MRRAVGWIVAGLLAAGPLEAQVSIIARSSGVSGTLLTFDGLALSAFTPVAALGAVSFSNAYLGDGLFGGFATPALYNVPPNFVPTAGLSINFGSVQNAAAFNVYTESGTTTFTAFLNAVMQRTFSASTTPAGSGLFYGFEQFAFDRIDVRSVAVGTTTIAPIGIDNLQYASAVVPEPATSALLVAGLAAMAFASRRRARHQATYAEESH